jgi:hypothetical protein
MTTYIFRIAVDRDWSSATCSACYTGLGMDAEIDALEKSYSSCCVCHDYDDTGCECPFYFHCITFSPNDDGSVHLKIEMNVRNPDTRAPRVFRNYELYEMDIASSIEDDSDTEILNPYIQFFKILFVSTKTHTSLTDVVGCMRSKRITVDIGRATVEALTKNIQENIVSMFSGKGTYVRNDLRWIQPLSKTLCRAIIASYNIPRVKSDKGCAHMGRKMKS